MTYVLSMAERQGIIGMIGLDGLRMFEENPQWLENYRNPLLLRLDRAKAYLASIAHKHPEWKVSRA